VTASRDDAPATLRWPDGMDEAGFLARHWQRAPLLMRQALPGFVTPLPPDELAGLSLEPDVGGRLIRRREDDTYALEHGPFDEETFATLGERDWSLLVTDVDKHVPELARWLMPFRVAPDWRLDDLMVSFAPDGGSVGAHVDEYDVFLLQASGIRRWSIAAPPSATASDDTPSRPPPERAAGDLRLVEDFSPSDSWDLEPGDVLYLPPGVAHHGVALGDGCTTWSIGFRAPSAADVVLHAAELVAERLSGRLPRTRLRDPGRGRGVAGEIDDATIDAVATLLREALTLDRSAMTELTGRLLTRSGTPADDIGSDAADGDADAVAEERPAAFAVTPFSRLAWCGAGERVELFVNGERHACHRRLARGLCESLAVREEDVMPEDGALFDTLREDGVLAPVDRA